MQKKTKKNYHFQNTKKKYNGIGWTYVQGSGNNYGTFLGLPTIPAKFPGKAKQYLGSL